MTAAIDCVRRYLDEPERSELDAALLVAELIGHAVARDGVEVPLAALSWNLEPSVDALMVRLAAAGFAGATDYYAIDNSRIDRVLTTRLGIPITLAVVYIEVGRRVGLDVHGISFPGHFLVDVHGAIVDPFAHTHLDRAALERLAPARLHGVAVSQLLVRASPDAVALRMINNVKGIRLANAGAGAVPDVLDLVDAQLALGGDAAALHLERADLWARLRSADAVRAALEAARSASTDPAVVREIDRRLGALPSRGGTWH
jgi:regulator of sirC expression with transglutaminase-like and TPR domain